MRPFPCLLRIAVCVCAVAISSSAQPHFTRSWSSTPYLAMNLYITAVSFDGVAATAGDEIGVFDGDVCVGAAVLAGPITAGTPVALVASTDDPTTGSIDGFAVGHTIAFRLWQSSHAKEYPDTVITTVFAAGTGAFASLGTAVMSLVVHLTTGVQRETPAAEFRLFQNYPNPFNGISEFAFRLPAGEAGSSESALVKLQVFDLLGREVAVLVDDRLGPGTYRVQFDGSRLSSGVYLCRLTAGPSTAVMQLILQR